MVRELAEFLVVSPNTIRKEIYQGKLRASKRSGTWIIERRDLLQYLENHSNLNME
ncbi:helix-turn-helix domain-containing protein [Entomospira nematocerorum]